MKNIIKIEGSIGVINVSFPIFYRDTCAGNSVSNGIEHSVHDTFCNTADILTQDQTLFLIFDFTVSFYV